MQLLVNGQAFGAEPPTLIEWQQVELACTPPPGTTLRLQLAGATLEPFLRPGDSAWRWRWNPQNGVGLFELLLIICQPDLPDERHAFMLRVVPRKIDQDAYVALIDDLQQVARELAYGLGGGTESAALGEPPGTPTPLESYYALLAGGVEQVRQLMVQIAAHPHETLRSSSFEQPLDQASLVGPEALESLARGEAEPAPPETLPDLQELLRPGGGALPRSLQAQRSTPSYDTYENRLLKHLLKLLAVRLRAYTALLDHERSRLTRNAGYVEAERGRLALIDDLLRQSAACAAQLRTLRAQPFLAQVAPLRQLYGPSQVMQRDPRYRAVYRLWQELRRQPLLDPASDLFRLPIHELPRLYEVWCVLRVAQALLGLPGAEVVGQLLIDRSEGDAESLALALPEGQPLLTLRLGTATLTLRYQPRYRPLARAEGRGSSVEEADSIQSSVSACLRGSTAPGSLDRHTRVPDIALELRRPGEPPQLWLLDAKYRLDSGGGVPQQALDDAYTYLGSIGLHNGRRAVHGAYLLYPGRGRGERYPSGVGALPLLPGAADALSPFLEEVVVVINSRS